MGKALDVIAAEPWLITPQGLEQIMAIAQRQGEDLEALGQPVEDHLNQHAGNQTGGVQQAPKQGIEQVQPRVFFDYFSCYLPGIHKSSCFVT